MAYLFLVGKVLLLPFPISGIFLEVNTVAVQPVSASAIYS